VLFSVGGQSNSGFVEVRLRCPSCRQRGIFRPFGQDVLINNDAGQYVTGQRECPATDCRTHVFFVLDTTTSQMIASYPPERLDFDATSLPPTVLAAFEEAIACHAAGCYVASGIMVRKTLEELCEERSAQGKNLKERITDLGSKVVLPRELLDGLDDLRLLGNDAAHVDSKVFQQVGREEVELSVEFTKEVLKAIYQYDDLLTRLRALKKP
jgi:Domain of unknown function (DUF4145)